jgi:hypothetical protein
MSLISGIDEERSCSGVHAGQMLAIHNFLNRQFSNVVPVLVISVLSQEGDRSLSVIRVQLGHIQIIDVIYHFYFTSGAVLLTCQFFQWGFQHIL